MMVFWLIAAGMLVAALAVLARPLLRGRVSSVADQETQNVQIARERLAELQQELRSGALDQAAFDRARADLETTLAADLAAGSEVRTTQPSGRWIGVLVLVAVPALALYLYLSLGSPGAIDGSGTAPMPSDHPDVAQQQDLPSIEQMVSRLAVRLQEQPDDPQGWFMLGRSYLALARYREAAEAFERTQQLVGDEPDVLVAYADALAMQQGGRLSGKPMELIQRALARDPDSATALWLAGMGYRETGQLDKAIQSWQRAKELLPPQADARNEIQSLIDEAAAQGGTTPPAANRAQTAAASGKVVHVTVALAPDLKAGLDPTTTVFVFASPPDGSRMPVAALKRTVSDLPLELELSDADALAPVARISNYQQVRVGARVSLSGNAIPSSGDLVAETKTVRVGADQPAQLLIDHRMP